MNKQSAFNFAACLISSLSTIDNIVKGNPVWSLVLASLAALNLYVALVKMNEED